MHEKIEKNDQEIITLFIRLIPNIHILHSSLTKAKKIIDHCSSSKHIYFPVKFPFKIELLIIGTLFGWKRDMQVKCLVHIAKLHATYNLFLNIWFIYLLRPISSLIFKMFPLSFISKEPKSQTPPLLYLQRTKKYTWIWW